MTQQQEVWGSTEDLFQDHMREVQNKWNTLKLNDDIWAKLIYFEQNRRLAKAYVSTPVLTIDGSTNGLDGFRIGLSGIENSYRNLDSIACLRSIGQGIKLKIDHQGNILIRKLKPILKTAAEKQQQQHAATCSVWVKDWPSSRRRIHADGQHQSELGSRRATAGANPLQKLHSHHLLSSSSCSSSSSPSSQNSSSSSASSSFEPVPHRSSASSSAARYPSGGPEQARSYYWPMQEIRDDEQTYKLFDMQKFRLQLEQFKRRMARSLIDGTSAAPSIDWHQCVSIISFKRSTLRPEINGARQPRLAASKQQHQVLTDPCWLMLINIIAIDMLKSFVCDLKPSPNAQTSALVNRYQASGGGNQDHLKMAARKLLPPLPVPSERLIEESVSALRTGLGGAASRYHNNNNQRLQNVARAKLAPPSSCSSSTSTSSSSFSSSDIGGDGQQNELLAGLSDAQVAYDSERLRRLNEMRYEQPLSTTSKRQLSASSCNKSNLLAASRSGSQLRSAKSSHQQQREGSIYTTFTGKYLDKQHRMRANKRNNATAAASSMSALAANHLGVAGQPPPPPPLVYQAAGYKLGKRDATRQQMRQELDGESCLVYHRPVARSSARPSHKQRLAGAYEPNQRASNWQTPSENRIHTGNHRLMHSVSAFDLSHGLKLNVGPINASSIRMNFDDEEEEEKEEEEEEEGEELEEHELQQEGDCDTSRYGAGHYKRHSPTQEARFRQHDRGGSSALGAVGRTRRMSHEDLFGRLNLNTSLRGSSSKSPSGARTLVELARNQRKAIKANNNRDANSSSSEWIDLAKKYSLIAGSRDDELEVGNEQQQRQFERRDQMGANKLGSKSVDELVADESSSAEAARDANNANNKDNNNISSGEKDRTRRSNSDYQNKEHKDSDEQQQQQEHVEANNATDDMRTTKLHQNNNISHSSIVSSSSSGCADNDYFVSQSSPSSMSSSSTTRSNEAEELSSQPANSSGIVCSGNTSGEDHDVHPQHQSSSDDKNALDDQGIELGSGAKLPADNNKPKLSSVETKQNKQATANRSKARSAAVKQLGPLPHHHHHHRPDRHHDQHRRRRRRHLYQTPCSPTEAQQSDPAATLDGPACEDCELSQAERGLCDCGASSAPCDRMMFVSPDESTPIGICDCFCDCLYEHQSDCDDDEHLAHVFNDDDDLVEPHHQDLLTCNCDDNHAGQLGSSSSPDQPGEHQEEPIYDHLPRFGRGNQTERSAPKATNNNNGALIGRQPHEATSRPKAGSKNAQAARNWHAPTNPKSSLETINDEAYDRIVALPMVDNDDNNGQQQQKWGQPSKLDKSRKKSNSATNLKRNSGWLESSKYLKLLPRFMSFASSTTTTSSYASSRTKQGAGSNVKSGTLDRAAQLINPFRRTRSSQNLSK